MAYIVPTLEDIRDGILRDIANQNPQAAVGADSDFRMRANATAAAIEGLYQFQAWTARQITPDTADDEIVERYASLYSMVKKSATPAVGFVAFGGTVGASINAGVEAKALDGRAYVTTAQGVIGIDGKATLSAQAAMPGIAGNQIAGTALVLTTAPAGISSTATIISMTAGTDLETPAALRARLLDRLRHPPAGGNEYDYRRWALEVPGVTAAWVYPLRRGLGTVDIAVVSNGVPAPQVLLNTVKAYIKTVNPAGGDCQALAPELVAVNVVAGVEVAGITLASVRATVQAVLGAYIGGLKPGDTVLRSRILASITDIPGVTDVILISPPTSVVTLVDAAHLQQAKLGAVTLS